MQKVFIFIICIYVSLLGVNNTQAIFQPRGPAIQTVILPVNQSATTTKQEAEAPKPIVKNTDPVKLADPTPQPSAPISNKRIVVSLAEQDLKYFDGTQMVGEFKISSGLKGTPTPRGEYTVLKKRPVVDYRGATYNFPHTKWNLQFKQGKTLSYYIHGAYWHNNFGQPMSHGCINVSYANMEPLYAWADVGTQIIIE